MTWREWTFPLNVAEARYLVVGAYAVIHYAEPRFTEDLVPTMDHGTRARPSVGTCSLRFPLEGALSPLCEVPTDRHKLAACTYGGGDHVNCYVPCL